MQYYVVVALQDQGAYVLLSTFADDLGGAIDGANDIIGIPAFPSARLLWVDAKNTTTPLYPTVSCDHPGNGTAQYTNGVAVEDFRVVDVATSPWATADGLADIADRFTRGNSSSSIGGNWTVVRGTWGISSNQGYLATDPGGAASWVYQAGTVYDGIYQCDITVPSGWNGSNATFGLVIRIQDTSNFIRIWNNNANQIAIQTWVSGAFGATVYSTAHTWTASQTNRWTILTKGNQYNVWIDGATVTGNAWKADSNNRFLTSTGIGLYSGLGTAQSVNARWDNIAVYPHTVSLPTELRRGKVPLVSAGSTTMAHDTFTDTNGTAITSHVAEAGGAWTSNKGTWTIQSNTLSCAIDVSGSSLNYINQVLSQPNGEASVDCIMSASLDNTNGKLRCGIVVLQYIDGMSRNNYIRVSFYKDPSQVNSDEIELYEISADSGAVQHKANVAHKFLASTTYTLKVQVKNGAVYVFLNGYPRITYFPIIPLTSLGFGICRNYDDSIDGVNGHAGTTFDNWVVKAL
jgi:hypothetical protein